jgi:hypothetical protein
VLCLGPPFVLEEPDLDLLVTALGEALKALPA